MMEFKIGDKVRIINDAYKYSSSGRKTGDEFIISKISPVQPDGNCYIFDNFDRAHYSLNLQKILMATDTRTSKRFEVHSYTDETVLEAMSNDGSALRGRPRAHVAIDGIDSPYVPVLALTNTIKDAADFLNDIARVSNMSKANCEVADQHAQALYRIIAPAPANTGKLSTPDVKSSPTDIDRLVKEAFEEIADGASIKAVLRGVITAAMQIDWIEWNGGKCPVVPGTKLHYKLRREPNASHKSDAPPEYLNWSHHHPDHAHYNFDIIAYRVVK